MLVMGHTAETFGPLIHQLEMPIGVGRQCFRHLDKGSPSSADDSDEVAFWR